MSAHWIITHSGKNLDLLDPDPDSISIHDIAHGLAHQCRFNGHTASFYSVAQHSMMVASLLPEPLKLAGLLHDAAEAYLGDMVQPLKQLLPEFARMEQRFTAAIGRRMRLDLSHHPAIKRADLIALATERRDLLPNIQGEWPVLSGVDPAPGRIFPLEPAVAEIAFKQMFYELRIASRNTQLKQFFEGRYDRPGIAANQGFCTA